MVYFIYSAMEAVLKKILALPLMFFSFSSFSEGVPSTDVQPLGDIPRCSFLDKVERLGLEGTIKH